MASLFPDVAGSSLITKINESALPSIPIDAGVANQAIIQQLHDTQVLLMIIIVLMIIQIIALYAIARRR